MNEVYGKWPAVEFFLCHLYVFIGNCRILAVFIAFYTVIYDVIIYVVVS